MTDRMQETRRARELHLLRDERDLEIQSAGQRRAGRAVLTLSQLLSALCVLQEDPAWTVLLSLSFAAGAVRAFHQFACDREGLYLALGLAASGAVLFLWAWFFRESGPEALSPGRLAVLLLLFWALSAVAALLFVGLTLGAFYLKYKLQHMNGTKWEAYFASLPTTALLARLGILLTASLLAAAAAGYALFGCLGFAAPLRLACVFAVLSAVRLWRKLSERQEDLVEKLLRLEGTVRQGADA